MALHVETPPGAAIYVGTAGWQYEDWKGVVYPDRLSRETHPLSLLCRWVDLVEINVSFYRPITARQCASWLEKTAANPRFTFTAKLSATVTHEQRLDAAVVKAYVESLKPLSDAGRLGAVLAQFPWSFKRTPDNRRYLADVIEAFSALPLAIEVRHVSWAHPAVFAGLRERGVAFCTIDQPDLEACLAPMDIVTAPKAYVRLHGRNSRHWFNQAAGRNDRYDYLYSNGELAPWIARILSFSRQVNDLYVITNNHYRGQAMVNALEIQASLGLLRETLPEHLCIAYPQLRDLKVDRARSRPPGF